MKRYVENDTAAPIFVGGSMILPGTGREVDVPDHLLPAADQPLLPDEGDDEGDGEPQWPEALVAVQALPVAKLKAALPDLSPEDLATLAKIEEASEPPRTSALEAIAALQLKRAQAAAGGAPT